MAQQQDQRVGRAYKGKDGIVRWITDRSRRGKYRLMWRNDAGQWSFGGTLNADQWPGSWADGEEVPAPQPGETITVVGAMGTKSEVVTGG
jgi:hypothetical protein